MRVVRVLRRRLQRRLAEAKVQQAFSNMAGRQLSRAEVRAASTARPAARPLRLMSAARLLCTCAARLGSCHGSTS